MESQETVIGGRTYKVAKLGARDGWKVLAKITALVGGALKAIGPTTKLASLGSVGAAGLGGMLETVSAGLADEWPTVEMLCKGTYVSNDNGVLVPMPSPDAQFAGKYEDLAEFLEFAVEVNFAGFFRKMASRVGIAPAPQAQASASNSTVS